MATNLIFITAGIALVLVSSSVAASFANSPALASSSNIEDEKEEQQQQQEEQVAAVPEKCNIILEDGYPLTLDRPQDVELSDGTVIKGHNCEELQQDYATTSYADYQAHLNRINEAREETGKMFAPDTESLGDKLDKIAEALDELNTAK